MASKIERVIEYIAKLEPGAKVSVRGLAQELEVSEGTAYKSIKAAEAQGLVMTRPKTGTVRINLRSASLGVPDTMMEAARSVGAVCLCGSEMAMYRTVPQIVVADGSEAQFRDTVHRQGRNILCVAGERPEIHRAAVELGTDLLLTGGAEIDSELLMTADREGLIILSSEQDSSTLLGMLNRRLSGGIPQREMGEVRDWMQLPRYLYHDDMITEWQRIYGDIFYEGSSCAIVDDSLKVCGTIDAMIAMNAAPAMRLSTLMDKPEEGSVVSEDMSMEELADSMIKNNRIFTAVTSQDGMSGFINLMDIIRYYKYNRSSRQFGQAESAVIHMNEDDSDEQRRFYTMQINSLGEKASRNAYVDNICSAAMWHAYDLMGGVVNLESGTFYSIAEITEPGEYMISSEIIKQADDSAVLELELFDNDRSYYKSTMKITSTPETNT